MKTKGSKHYSAKQIEDMKSIIRPRLKFRDTSEQLLMALEDKGFDIGLTKLYEIKKLMRSDLEKRFEEIGNYELAEEHDLAIQTLKDLERTVREAMGMAANTRDIISCVQEIRNIKRDLLDFYGSSEIVENVFKYFEEKYGDKATEAIKKVKKETLKKTKKTNKELDTFE